MTLTLNTAFLVFLVKNSSMNGINFLGTTLGIYEGPGRDGEVITLRSTEPLIGKYVVVQLMSDDARVNLNEVVVICSGE